MRATQLGDRVQVHYVKRFPDGTVRSSRARGDAPLEVTVGTGHPRLPGLGSELVGLAAGKSVTLTVPAERAYGLPDPNRVRRVARTRFGRRLRGKGHDEDLAQGLVHVPDRAGPCLEHTEVAGPHLQGRSAGDLDRRGGVVEPG